MPVKTTQNNGAVKEPIGQKKVERKPEVVAVKAYPSFLKEPEDDDPIGPIHVEMARVICNDIRKIFGKTKKQKADREAKKRFTELCGGIGKKRKDGSKW